MIALMVPVTSRGRRLSAAADADFIRTLIPSVIRTATWTADFAYTVYVGYDAGDRFYDRPSRQQRLREAFAELAGDRALRLVLIRCAKSTHAPCSVWNRLFRRAYDDGCDFFYQLGDDVKLETRGWARDFRAALQRNAAYPGLGVAGPVDADRPRFPVLTQAFVSRVHMAIFGTLYPRAFRNWYSDNWLTAVYAPWGVSRSRAHRVRNTGGRERYTIDHAGRDVLQREAPIGRVRIAAWLQWARR